MDEKELSRFDNYSREESIERLEKIVRFNEKHEFKQVGYENNYGQKLHNETKNLKIQEVIYNQNNFRYNRNDQNYTRSKKYYNRQYDDNNLISYKSGRSKQNDMKIILEETDMCKKVMLFGYINGKEYEMLVDTGATDNYVSEEFSNLLKVETQKLDTPQITTLADGTKVSNESKLKFFFGLNSDARQQFLCEAKVMRNLQPHVVLGMAFLQLNNAIINLRDGFVTISGMEIELNRFTDTMANSTKNIFDNLFSCNIINSKIGSLIKKTRKEAPALGTITTFKHKIVLNKPFLSDNRVYTIPTLFKEKFKDEISRLLKLDIIRKVSQ